MENQLEAGESAWEAGRKSGLYEAAALAESRHEQWTTDSGVSCDVTACEDIAEAIRALKDK
jgi:hypothetical protein